MICFTRKGAGRECYFAPASRVTITLEDGSMWNIYGLPSGYEGFRHVAVPAFLHPGFQWALGLSAASAVTCYEAYPCPHIISHTGKDQQRSAIAGSKGMCILTFDSCC